MISKRMLSTTLAIACLATVLGATQGCSKADDPQQASAGVTRDFVRLSIGTEDIEDILWDLDQALQKG